MTPAATEEKTKTTLALEQEYAEDANRFVRAKPYDVLRRFLKRPDMTHIQFCDLKAQAWAELWSKRKANPAAGRKVKPLTDEQLARKQAKMEAQMAAYNALKAEIAASEALKKKK